MRVLLVKPPYTRLKGAGQAPYFPLGLGYIAAVLREKGHEAFIYHAENPRMAEDDVVLDAETVFESRSSADRRYHAAVADIGNHHVWHEVRDTVRSVKPDLIGITMLSPEMPSALAVSRICKSIDSSIPVVWGGVHPSFEYADCLRHPEVDYVVRGEGEIAMLELCEALERKVDPSCIRGLIFRGRDGSLVCNDPQPPLPDMDAIPFPARNAVLYPESFDFRSLGSMIISRGCPFRCTFCSSRNFWGKTCRFRSPANVLEEIRHLKADYGTRHIMFWDDTLTMKRSTVEKYCHAFVDSRLGVSWKAATRADLIDDDLLGLMKKAGCVKLEIGVESGSDRIKKLIYKDVNNEQIEKAFRLINNAGIGSGAFFMAGFPEETIADLEDTFNLMKRLDATEMSFNIFDPMPGSDEYEKCKKMGLVPESPDWSAFPFWPDAHYAGMMARGEFDAKAVEIAEWLYGRNNSFRYKWRRNRQYIMSLAANDPMEAARKIAGFARRRWTVARRRDEK